MSDPDEAIRKGKRAQQILDDDLFKEIIRALRDKALEQFRSAHPGDITALTNARIRYDVVEQIVTELNDMKRDGDFEQHRKNAAKPPLKPGEAFVGRHGVQ